MNEDHWRVHQLLAQVLELHRRQDEPMVSNIHGEIVVGSIRHGRYSGALAFDSSRR